jgi:glycosyltransferase involved in cell wall biosynthesis
MLEPGSIAKFRQQSTELRHSLDLAEDAYVIGTVGRVAKEKGFQYAIEAMTTVLKYVPGARLVIVGDGPHRDALVAQARALHLETRVRFAGHQTDVNPWLALFDLFVLPTPWEAFGLVLLEAMRFSIPVIATDCAGPTEIIQDQQSGILVPPRDSAVLARAIIELSQDPERSRRIGSSGLQTVEQCYSVDKMVEATLAFYDEQRA